MYDKVTKEDICYFISAYTYELDILQKRILVLTKETAQGADAEIGSILSASFPSVFNANGPVTSSNKRDLGDVCRRAVKLLHQRGEEAFCELRALVERQETMMRVMTAYKKLPQEMQFVLREMYECRPEEKTANHIAMAISRIEEASGWKRSHIFNIRNKGIELIIKIYESRLSARQIHQLDLTTYKGGPLENYIRKYR